MTKNTFDLYRCSALEWAKLDYEDALHFRIDKAKKAMTYYRRVSTLMPKMSDGYKSMQNKYLDSEDAREWNKGFVEEIENERKKLKEKP